MNDNDRALLQYVCEGDILKAQKQAHTILDTIKSQKDAAFRKRLLRQLEAKGPSRIELPYNLKELPIAEDSASFPESRFLVRKDEQEVINKALSTLRASRMLEEKGVRYQPAIMLYGISGGGKTMLARYIAHKANLPFVYVRFSNIVVSRLGETQIGRAHV